MAGEYDRGRGVAIASTSRGTFYSERFNVIQFHLFRDISPVTWSTISTIATSGRRADRASPNKESREKKEDATKKKKKKRNSSCRKYARGSGFTAVGRRWSRDSRAHG